MLKGTATKITSQEGGFLNFCRPLMTVGLLLMKSVLFPIYLAKSVLIPLELWAGMSAVDAAIQKKIYWSQTKELIISKEGMEDIMKIVKLLQESRLLIKGISQIIKNEAKEKKDRFLPISLGTLSSSILANALTGNGVIRAGERESNKS